ncbi:TonB-dependent receptor [Sphingomonas oryzagri]
MTALVARRSAPALVRLALGASLIGLVAGVAQAQSEGATQQGVPNADTAATGGPNSPASTSTVANGDAPVQAASDQGVDANVITVTGIRAALDSAAKIKRLSTTIVDSVSAEDIGKLPDVSIADSLARLPGVTAQRLEGRDQRLSIRGLGPDFSTTLLNGREQVTVGDNRGVEYDQYPSEFFKTVNVYKSADASLIAAGISGTVDLRMLRPLAQPNRVFSVQARGQMNDYKALTPQGKRYGYRASATYVDKFADDTLGIALGFSKTSLPSQDKRYNAWGYSGAGTADSPYVLGGAKPYVQSNLLDRTGGVATIEWQPSDTFHSTFDALYSHFSEKQHLNGIEFPLAYGAQADGSALPTTNNTVVDGFATSTTFDNVHGVQRNDYNRRKADTLSLGWNNVLSLSDTTHFTVDASWSHAKRKDFLLETYTGTGYNKSGAGDTVTVTQNKNGTYSFDTGLDYSDANLFQLTDPQGWGYNGTSTVVQAGFLNQPKFKDDLKSLRASLDGEFGNGPIKGWEIGANFSRRKKTSAYTSYFLCPKGGDGSCVVADGRTPTSAPVPQDAVLGSIALGYLGIPQILALDPVYLYKNAYDAFYDNRPVSLVRDNGVTENVWTGYGKLKIDGDLANMPLRGSLGAQVVNTRQSSTGSTSAFNSTTGVVTIIPLHEKVNYTRFLPSLALSLEVIPGSYVKFGAARTMVRPRLDQERVNRELVLTPTNIGAGGGPINSPFSFNAGNTQLRPYMSTNLDVSLEKYFTNSGYVSLAGFYKKLSDFINPQESVEYDFSDYLSLFSAQQQQQILASGGQIGLSKQPTNRGHGHLQGFEGTLSLPFKDVTSFLDGFGFYGNISYTKSRIIFDATPDPITVPGASKWVYNTELYFEKSGFQARVSYTYRSKFLGEVAGLSANPTYREAKAEGILDAQIGYEFQSGALKGLSILAQAKNLTDRPFVTYQNNDTRQVIDYQRYGRDYYLGVAYKF